MPGSLFAPIVFLAIIVLIGAIPGLRDREMKGRSWLLLQAFFPSWRFFEDLHAVPKLWFRILEAEEASNDADRWIECWPSENRAFHSIFINAHDGLRMAAQSLVEKFVSEIADLPASVRVDDTVSYQLVVRSVRFQILRHSVAAVGWKFQFKVVSVVPGTDEKSRNEEILISAVHRI